MKKRKLWPLHLLRGKRHKPEKERGPEPAEIDEAIRILEAKAKPVVFGALGGKRAESNSAAQSWWGGNFLGSVGEKPPVDAVSGQPMQPILQIRVDELPVVPTGLEGVALLNVWMDIHDKYFWDGENGNGYLLRPTNGLRTLCRLRSNGRRKRGFLYFRFFGIHLFPNPQLGKILPLRYRARLRNLAILRGMMTTRWCVNMQNNLIGNRLRWVAGPHGYKGRSGPKTGSLCFR